MSQKDFNLLEIILIKWQNLFITQERVINGGHIMLREAMYTTIETLWHKGCSKSEISRLTKHDWKTVNKVINAIKLGRSAPIRKPHCNLSSMKNS